MVIITKDAVLSSLV